MAKLELANLLNHSGPLYVDTTCIDCGTCFHIAPAIFIEENDLSHVVKQPTSLVEWVAAKEAIVSCPTNSIGVHHPPREFRDAIVVLPRLITENVYYCGYTSPDSFGATSYFIKRKEGNILIDSPRFHPHLVKSLEQLGGVDLMFLTHQDDVADHALFAKHFRCKRIIHRQDVNASTMKAEIILDGPEDHQLTEDLSAIHTPGHTKGHMVLLYKNEFLFTGDHLFYDADNEKLYASKNVNWYSWNEQLTSIHKLLGKSFTWVLPGHGGWVQMEEKRLKQDLQAIH